MAERALDTLDESQRDHFCGEHLDGRACMVCRDRLARLLDDAASPSLPDSGERLDELLDIGMKVIDPELIAARLHAPSGEYETFDLRETFSYALSPILAALAPSPVDGEREALPDHFDLDDTEIAAAWGASSNMACTPVPVTRLRAFLAHLKLAAVPSSPPAGGKGDDELTPAQARAIDPAYGLADPVPASVSPGGEGERARLILDAKDRWMRRALAAERQLAALVTEAVEALHEPKQTGEGREQTETAAYRDGWRTGVGELAAALRGEHPDFDPREGRDAPAREAEKHPTWRDDSSGGTDGFHWRVIDARGWQERVADEALARDLKARCDLIWPDEGPHVVQSWDGEWVDMPAREDGGDDGDR